MKFTSISFGPKHFWIISKMTYYHFGTWDFGKSHFGTYVSLWEHFSTCTVWPCRCSSRWTFQHRNILAWGLFGTGNFCFRNFRHIDISEYLGTWTFRHMDFWHLAKQYGQKFFMPKSPHVETFPCWNLQEHPQHQTVHMPKCSHYEKSVPKWLLPKS